MSTISRVRNRSPWKWRIGWSVFALGGLAACMQWRQVNRRDRVQNRVLCSELLPIRWRQGTDTAELIGNLEEIWATGAVVSSEEEILAREVVMVTPAKDFRARVMSAWREETGFFVEIKFRGSDKWSMEVFAPEHALDLSKMQLGRQDTNSAAVTTSIRLVDLSR